MRLAVVVQRYGADISGGAELHARYVAEHLAAHADVRVLTTCAHEHITWRNDFPPGADSLHGVAIERFKVERPRDVVDFGRWSERVFNHTHSLDDELRWMLSEGPVCRDLIARLRRSGNEFDAVLIFSIRYYQAYYAARAVSSRAVLVPTAEREASIGLQIFQPVFRGVRAIMYNSFEERAMINVLSGNAHVPGDIVGVGSEVPARTDPDRVRAKYGLHNPYVIYVGRIEANKGCAELFTYFTTYLERSGRPLDLILVGTPTIQVPAHAHIRHLGYVPDADKFDAMAGAEALIMPSYFESLSMVVLEAWALGRPVLVNAKCDVLVGQSLRSNGGLYYADIREFGAALDRILEEPGLRSALGANGRAYFHRHYAWPVIEGKYLEMFARLQAEPPHHTMDPLPGWWQSRARVVPPAAAVVSTLPYGAVLSFPQAAATRSAREASRP
jgi:glycosyltransferase involved in cell wall biosynthesis